MTGNRMRIFGKVIISKSWSDRPLERGCRELMPISVDVDIIY